MVSRMGSFGKKISTPNMPDIKALSNTDQLEVGSMVELASDRNVILYGVIRWVGVPVGKKGDWAGIELVSEHDVQ